MKNSAETEKTRRAREIIRSARPILRSRVEPDPRIMEVAREFPRHHTFLKNSVHATYQRQSRFLRRVATGHFGREEGLRVLDWGCGKGQNAFLMKQQGFEVTACDVQTDLLGVECPLLEGIDLVPLNDPVKLPFETASFDVVTSFGVLEHVPQDLASMKEIKRILKPNGLFYITFLPYPFSWTQALTRMRSSYEWRDYHDRFYFQRTLQGLAPKAGFSIAGLWFAQLFPKNSVPRALDPVLEPLDRMLCNTPLRYLATNLEAVLVAD